MASHSRAEGALLDMAMKNLLILSPFDGLSHRFWRENVGEWLAQQDDYQVTQVALPARYFAWRHRGNSLTYSRHPELDGEWDLVIATSMTDLSSLRGLNASMRDVPVVLYFHENQFAYPGHDFGLLERQITNIYSALSANHVVFNSEFNRRTFLEGAEALLKKMPDEVPKGVVQEISDKSSVIPVALDLDAVGAPNRLDSPLKIIWNHRWEHDKGPDRLLTIVQGLLETDLEFQLSLVGEQFREQPSEMIMIMDMLKAKYALGETGFVESREAYLNLLGEHHVVLSTARQEFQGLSIMEGICQGCLPVTPDDLSYVEYVPEELRYSSEQDAVHILTTVVQQQSELPSLDLYQWQAVGPAWNKLVDGFI
ncbi:MAG: DUF3524 domain-containing protein [Pseudomonadales bacterium]|nr:DUF3524 domain-containing protein [Pseudomonadales bacterium]MBO7007068.1 DUF3524 domain-containing protein [Pseudomonadales bacterium]